MPYARVRGLSLFYETYGAGPPLVVAHGALGSVALPPSRVDPRWMAARGVRVIAYDARGHGRSDHTTRREDYHWGALAEDLLGLMDALGLERASVYGMSMGAAAALMLAVSRPDRVHRLVLRNPPALEGLTPAVRRRVRGLIVALRYLGIRPTAWLVGRVASGVEAERLQAMLGHQRSPAITYALRGLLSTPPLPTTELSGIAAPTLVLVQPDDVMHPLASGEALAARLSHATLQVAPSRGYWRQHPEELAELIAAFVRSPPR